MVGAFSVGDDVKLICHGGHVLSERCGMALLVASEVQVEVLAAMEGVRVWRKCHWQQ